MKCDDCRLDVADWLVFIEGLLKPHCERCYIRHHLCDMSMRWPITVLDRPTALEEIFHLATGLSAPRMLGQGLSDIEFRQLRRIAALSASICPPPPPAESDLMRRLKEFSARTGSDMTSNGIQLGRFLIEMLAMIEANSPRPASTQQEDVR